MKNILLLVLLTPTLFYSQVHQWERTNPGGGGAYSTIGASVSGIIIAGSDLSGAYRSIDHGLTWDVLGASKGLTETHISGVGFSRVDGNLIFIGTEYGIFRSPDGGESLVHVLEGGYITDIEFSTDVPTIGYASSHPEYDSNDGVVFKTVDNGISWTQISTDLPSGIRILKLAVDPANSDIVYAVTGQGRFACGPADVFKSTNGGVSWENLTSTLPEVMDFAIDTNNPSSIYLTTMNANCDEDYYWTDLSGNIYNSTNGGGNWTQLSAHTGIIWLNPSNPNTIRLIDPREPYDWIETSGTWTSSDNGVSFTHTGFVENWDTFFNENLFYSYSSSYNGLCKTIGEDLSNNDNLFWVNYQWVFRTNDGGNTFENIFTDETIEDSDFWRSRGFDNVNMMDAVINDINPNLIFLAYFDIGLWRSLDQGQSWQSCNPTSFTGNWDGHGGNCASVVSDPTRPEVVWATMSGNQNGENPTYLIKNENMGQSDNWMSSNSGMPNEEIMGLSLDRNSSENQRTLFVTAQGDIYKSIDDGVTWQMSLDNGGLRFTSIDYFNSDLVYAGGENGLWRSLDGGSSWEDMSHPEMTGSVNSYFWGDYDGVFDIQTDPNITSQLYVVAHGTNKGLFKSSDAGNTWENIQTDNFMRKVAISPQNSNIVYATSSSAFEAGGYDLNSNGVYYSTDAGNTWIIDNGEMAYPFAMTVAVSNEAEPKVLVGSPGTGFQISAVPLGLTEFNKKEKCFFFPNPSNNEITINCDFITSDVFSDIEITNYLGETIISIKHHTLSDPIIIRHLVSGIYFLKISTSNNKLLLSKFVKH